eukprot:SM000039S14501  [mRNA]  locus=s39:405402:405842:+ [translate_table: standard]
MLWGKKPPPEEPCHPEACAIQRCIAKEDFQVLGIRQEAAGMLRQLQGRVQALLPTLQPPQHGQVTALNCTQCGAKHVSDYCGVA